MLVSPTERLEGIPANELRCVAGWPSLQFAGVRHLVNKWSHTKWNRSYRTKSCSLTDSEAEVQQVTSVHRFIPINQFGLFHQKPCEVSSFIRRLRITQNPSDSVVASSQEDSGEQNNTDGTRFQSHYKLNSVQKKSTVAIIQRSPDSIQKISRLRLGNATFCDDENWRSTMQC